MIASSTDVSTLFASLERITMPKTPRKLRKEAERRNKRDELVAKSRKEAVRALEVDPSATVRDIASTFNLSRTVAHRIKKAFSSNDSAELEKLVNPRQNRAGRRCVLSQEEENLLKAGASRFGFEGKLADQATVRSAMVEIASDGRQNT